MLHDHQYNRDGDWWLANGCMHTPSCQWPSKAAHAPRTFFDAVASAVLAAVSHSSPIVGASLCANTCPKPSAGPNPCPCSVTPTGWIQPMPLPIEPRTATLPLCGARRFPSGKMTTHRLQPVAWVRGRLSHLPLSDPCLQRLVQSRSWSSDDDVRAPVRRGPSPVVVERIERPSRVQWYVGLQAPCVSPRLRSGPYGAHHPRTLHPAVA